MTFIMKENGTECPAGGLPKSQLDAEFIAPEFSGPGSSRPRFSDSSVDESVAEMETLEKQSNAVQRLRLLWEGRSLLSRAVSAGLLLGTLVAFLIPKRFESTTQLMPPDAQSNSGMAIMAALSAKSGNGAGALAGDLLGIKNSGALFMGILSSRTVQERLVERFDLRRVYGYRLQGEARRKLAENTRMSEDRMSGILSITVTDRSPQLTAEIAQAYVEELNRLVVELSTSAAHRERVFLEERLTTVKHNLDQASAQFSQFSSRNVAIDIKEQGRAMIDAAATLTGQLIAAESEARGLQQIYSSSNVHVLAVQARITELREQLAKLGGREDVGPGSLAGRDAIYPSIRQLPLLGVTYADLYRQTKIQETVFETLTQEYELAKVQEAKETPSVKVLDPAAIAEKRSYPPRLEIVLLCSCLSLLGAMAWILGQAHWREINTLDPGKVLAQEVLHSVNAKMPWASPNGSRLQAMAHRVWKQFERQRNPSSGAAPLG